MKFRKKEILILIIILIIQTILYIFVGTNKSYLHIDEAYSYGLSNYNRIEIQDNDDFFNAWHSKDYYEDYLSVQDDEVGDFSPVYENQKNDVHPPFYYLLLRFFMNFSIGHFSKWSGIVLNIVIYAFITIFMYLILRYLFKGEKRSIEKSSILAFMSSIILASLSNVIYIRMYSLLTLEILITTFLHIKLLESENLNYKLLIGIGVSVLAGILTHYYYLFYLFILYLIFMIKYIKEKNFKLLTFYTLTMLISGILSLIIFPYSIQHMFFGYRGQGVISSLKNIGEIIPNLFSQIYNLNYYAFNGLLFIILVIIIGILIYNKIRKNNRFEINQEKKNIIKIIALPSIFFFIIASIASPWQVLRYIVPICGLLFILIIYLLYKLLKSICSENLTNILVLILFCLMLVTPLIFNLKPELLYTERKDIVQKLSDELNLPAIYLYDSQNVRFLDDILVFSKMNESYIAKDTDYSKENLKKISENKDISNGIIVFTNANQDRDFIVNTVKENLNFTVCEYLDRLTSCDVYYLH